MDGKMNIGKVDIDIHTISKMFGFPIGWEIQGIVPKNPKVPFNDKITFIISGKEFPEVKKGEEIPRVILLCHKEEIKFEVKRIQ